MIYALEDPNSLNSKLIVDRKKLINTHVHNLQMLLWKVLLKVTLKKIPTRRLVFLFLVGPPGLEPGTKGL